MTPADPGRDPDLALPIASDAPDDPDAPRPIRILQGYLWFPKALEVDLGTYLPERLDPDIHVLWDELPAPPFTFFDDGTLAATQRVHQVTVLTFAASEEEAGRYAPWLAETLQAALERTPEGVGWQIVEDLRPLG